jgi:hypothetical protein
MDGQQSNVRFRETSSITFDRLFVFYPSANLTPTQAILFVYLQIRVVLVVEIRIQVPKFKEVKRIIKDLCTSSRRKEEDILHCRAQQPVAHCQSVLEFWNNNNI